MEHLDGRKRYTALQKLPAHGCFKTSRPPSAQDHIEPEDERKTTTYVPVEKNLFQVSG